MWRALLVMSLLSLVASALAAQETKAPANPSQAAAAKLRDNPNDAEALTTYVNDTMLAAIAIMQADPAGALQSIGQLETFLDKLQTSDAGAKNAIARGRALAGSYKKRIELQQIPIAVLEKKLQTNPGDRDALNNYLQKVTMEISPLISSHPDEASQKLESVKTFVSKLSDAATDEVTKLGLRGATQILANMERGIELGQKQTKMIGKPAAPLKIEAWVNGSPLTDKDLQGKVVLLDFWAVWCGPCVATFPHLREWNEKYGDKGLVVIGLTQYYNFKWDVDEKKAARSQDEVPKADEREMLLKFAASHDLQHRFAIQADDSLSEYYGVTGIPHAVLIDQQGKIRLMKVGSGDENAKAIGDLLDELLTKK
jgi:thiol-disulfide isomerase/thioredoxin